MRRLLKCTTGAIVLFVFQCAPAQVPQLISYQGRVVADGTNFDGAGLFKFALVNAAGDTTYWSNDGTSTAGSEPTAAVSLPVTKGLYSVLLGDATQPNMTVVPATVFANAGVHLRIWFNDGVNGFQLLAPDKRIAAVGYAMMADTVADGAITSVKLAAGAVGTEQLGAHSVQTEKIAPGAVGAAQLAAGAAVSSLAASGQTGVPSGGLIISELENAALTDAGYIKIGATLGTLEWRQLLSQNPPTGRRAHAFVWTGSETIVWGGYNGAWLNDGSRYNLALDSWTAVTEDAAPSPRYNHSAVWTGTEMIIWGGYNGSILLNDGARYNPQTDSWTTITNVGAPVARDLHTAVWTGTEMIVWGGSSGGGAVQNTGARYNPSTDVWTAVTTENAPSSRRGHVGIWTGTEMIIYGGADGPGSQVFGDGARYNPTTESWLALPALNAPSPRIEHTVVWTGSEMIVWGGESGGQFHDSGARYSSASNMWSAMGASGLGGRSKHVAVWTGSEMLIWGGDAGTFLETGARFTPASSKWTPILGAPPAARISHNAVWTGTEMLVHGGVTNGGGTHQDDLWRYRPGKTLFLYQRP
jgi:hypothetical protein